MKKLLCIFLWLTFFTGTFYNSDVFCDQKKYMTIGTGAITGLYYLTGGAIALIVNDKNNENNFRLSVVSTSGSVYNIDSVASGELELAIVQSDSLYQAYNGLSKWINKKQTKLRAIFSIYPEIVTLIASESSNITSIESLKNKRVNIGNPNSGQRKNAIHALESVNINIEKDIKFIELDDYKIPEMIQSNQLDAAFFTAGHPIDMFNTICSGKTQVRFIPISDVNPLIQKYPYYVSANIPAYLYPPFKENNNIASFGVKSILIGSEDIDENIIFLITKQIFKKLDRFKKFHPVYSTLNAKYMTQGLTAPIHPGALKYYNEAKILK